MILDKIIETHEDKNGIDDIKPSLFEIIRLNIIQVKKVRILYFFKIPL